MRGYTLEEKGRLVTGRGAWATAAIEGKADSVRMNDGPHGLRVTKTESIGENNDSIPATCFPTASAVASSFDREAVALMARAIAKEASDKTDIVLGPGINMKRSPLCGRNFEYYAEDPYLAGELGSSYVKAMQELGIGTSLKHFAGNSQETRRMTADSRIDERALREIYLRAFEKVVKEAKPLTIMASYNRLNGEFACKNKHLLTDILREEWGYEGTVISDWGACNDLGSALNAGMDLEMPGSGRYHVPKLLRSIEKSKESEEGLNRAVINVLKLDTFCKETRDKRKNVSSDTENAQIARELAQKSAVLLRNEGLLPLQSEAFSEENPLVIVGAMAKTMRFQGGGSSHINATKQPDFVRVMKESRVPYTYYPGYALEHEEVNPSLEEEALLGISRDSIVLFFGGLTDCFEGEGYDRTTLALPKNQTILMEKLHQKGARIIFIAMGGASFDLGCENFCEAVLLLYLAGQEVDEACKALVFGEVNPSGKLAETFPYSIEDVPCADTFGKNSDEVEYRESLYMGYRYYDTFKIPVRYCFGHGLSYTDFLYKGLITRKTDEGVWVEFDLENVGRMQGEEIVQVYVRNPKGEYLRAARELRGFSKISLVPQETKHIRILLDDRSFQVFDEKDGYVTVAGEYGIEVGASLQDIRLTGTLLVEGKEYLNLPTKKDLPEYFAEGPLQIGKEVFAKLYKLTPKPLDIRKPGEFGADDSIETLAKYSKTAKLLKKIAVMYTKSLFKKKPENDPEVMMFIRGITEGTLDCVMCQSNGLVPIWLVNKIVKEANKGERKNEL